jgi:hypothetical protein
MRYKMLRVKTDTIPKPGIASGKWVLFLNQSKIYSFESILKTSDVWQTSDVCSKNEIRSYGF